MIRLEDTDFAKELSVVGQRGCTLADLAEALRDVGRPIDRIGLGKLERGIRRIDVDDLVAMALVFDVNPKDLLSDWWSRPGLGLRQARDTP